MLWATMPDVLQPNPGKQLVRSVRGKQYARYPVKTHVVSAEDGIADVVARYARPHLRAGDILAVSERIVAIAQGRAFPLSAIQPSPLARFLTRFVLKPSWGIGLGSPWTMELALREAGTFRVLLAAFFSAVTKPFGARGVFYKVVGNDIAAIDGPTLYTLPPYNGYAKLPPKNPDRVAASISSLLDIPVAVMDANDIGVTVLGATPGVDRELLCDVFRDNPLGQSDEQTPLCVVRAVDTVG